MTLATLTPEPSDPEAWALFQQIEAAMNQLTTLKAVEVLRDGSGNTLTTTLEYAAPGQVRLTTDTSAQSIGIHNQQWARARNEPLWSTWTRPEPFRFPDFRDSREAVDVQLGSETELNGEAIRTVMYAFLDFEGRFDFVVYANTQSLLIRRLTMKGPGHDMVTDYVDYAPRVVIRTPQPDQIAPIPTVTIP